jgi:ATP-dependent RNA helicase RhlE
VFTRTKHGANKLAKQLEGDGIRASAIHGNKSQAARTRALADFKRGEVQVLVATDIASRGLDIDSLPYVVNFELPDVCEDYVHRIGRTGRATREGIAISLVCIDELEQLKGIERLMKRTIPQEIIDGYEPDPSIKAEPILRGGNRSQRAPGGGNSAFGKFRGDARGNKAGAGRTSGSGKKIFPGSPQNEDAVRGRHDGSRKHAEKTRRLSSNSRYRND